MTYAFLTPDLWTKTLLPPQPFEEFSRYVLNHRTLVEDVFPSRGDSAASFQVAAALTFSPFATSRLQPPPALGQEDLLNVSLCSVVLGVIGLRFAASDVLSCSERVRERRVRNRAYERRSGSESIVSTACLRARWENSETLLLVPILGRLDSTGVLQKAHRQSVNLSRPSRRSMQLGKHSNFETSLCLSFVACEQSSHAT